MNKKIVILMLASLLSACGGSSKSTPPPLQGPTGLAVENNGTAVTVSWDEVVGATTYHLYYAHEPIGDIRTYAAYVGGTWLQNVTSPITFTVDEDLPVYHIVVTAVVNGRETAQSELGMAFPRYTISVDGTEVADASTGLTWARCVYGMGWDADEQACTGDPIYTNRDTAIAAAADAGYRVPTINEINALVFCHDGKLNYFPNQTTSCRNIVLDNSPAEIIEYFFPRAKPNTTDPGAPGFSTIGQQRFITVSICSGTRLVGLITPGGGHNCFMGNFNTPEASMLVRFVKG